MRAGEKEESNAEIERCGGRREMFFHEPAENYQPGLPPSFFLPARSAASPVILRGARSLQPCNYGSIGRRASRWPARNCRVQTERKTRNGTLLVWCSPARPDELSTGGVVVSLKENTFIAANDVRSSFHAGCFLILSHLRVTSLPGWTCQHLINPRARRIIWQLIVQGK